MNLIRRKLMPILSGKGLDPKREFTCTDCGEKFTGQNVIDDTVRLHFVQVSSDKNRNVFRCECCQEDHEEKHGEED
jgi:hypothetical protein